MKDVLEKIFAYAFVFFVLLIAAGCSINLVFYYPHASKSVMRQTVPATIIDSAGIAHQAEIRITDVEHEPGIFNISLIDVEAVLIIEAESYEIAAADQALSPLKMIYKVNLGDKVSYVFNGYSIEAVNIFENIRFDDVFITAIELKQFFESLYRISRQSRFLAHLDFHILAFAIMNYASSIFFVKI